jgi:hypothetical protein
LPVLWHKTPASCLHKVSSPAGIATYILDAGATQAYPGAIEASLRLGATALEMVGASAEHVDGLLQGGRDRGYDPVRDDPAQDPKAPGEAR